MAINFHLLMLLLSKVASLQVNDTWETAWGEVKTNIELEKILASECPPYLLSPKDLARSTIIDAWGECLDKPF